MFVPCPVGQCEGIVFCPLQCFVADDAGALAGDNKIRRAGSVAMSFRVLARTEQLNATTERWERVSAGPRSDIFQGHAVVRASGLISERA